jgi:S-methylmethionine-dependent homocysteine/selenocysteine methylase
MFGKHLQQVELHGGECYFGTLFVQQFAGRQIEDAAAERDKIIAGRLLDAIRDEFETQLAPFVISGCVGPRGDGYNAGTMMSSDEALDYHRAQIRAFSEAGAEMVTAITMTYAEEAIGVTLAASEMGMPVAISFTVETDGRLPSGQSLKDAIGIAVRLVP